jgi:lysophospholipid acyltransferase (LPLAT)-like uncharacterized protein
LAVGPSSAHKKGLQTDETNSINEVRGWRWLALWLLALLVRAWGRSLRLDLDPASEKLMRKSDEPVAFTLWHNRLFLTPELFRRYRGGRPVHGLVSASKDGAWLAAFYRMVGITPVRGSSSNFGREAARSLIEVMRAGEDIGITPDGPRGPIYTVEPGVLVVTRRNQAPMLIIGGEFGPAWRLKSWDRFYLPWPFTRVKVRLALLTAVKADGTKLTAEEVRAGLLAINPDASDGAAVGRTEPDTVV